MSVWTLALAAGCSVAGAPSGEPPSTDVVVGPGAGPGNGPEPSATGGVASGGVGGMPEPPAAGGGPSVTPTPNCTDALQNGDEEGVDCGGSCTPCPSLEPPTTFEVMSYNLYGWNALVENPWKGDNIAALIDAASPDFLGVQELEGKGAWLLESLSAPYALAGQEQHGVAIVYRTDRWMLDDTDVVLLKEQDQWGQRIVRWAHFTHQQTGQGIYHFNTHFCVCDGEKLLGSAKTVTSAIAARQLPDPVILTGDFNVFPGFENSLAVQHFLGDHDSPMALLDSFGALHPEEMASTFYDAGRIDYVFVSEDLEVLDASIDRTTISPGEGSDHDPALATLKATAR